MKLATPKRTAPQTARSGRPVKLARRGVTLIEVLMALMIMSIGVSAVAVLFPIATLRSIQATQLTNGAIVKYNVEELININPGLVFDPDGDLADALRYPTAATRRTAKIQALTEHYRTPAARNYIVDPFGFYNHLADGNPGIAAVFGNDGSSPLGIPRFGGGLRLTNGRRVPSAPPAPPIAAPPLTSSELEALRLRAIEIANQGDGWETQIDAQPAGLTAGGVVLDGDLDLTQVPTAQLALPRSGPDYLVADPDMYRMVLFSENGKFSQAFPLTAIDTATNTAYFTEDVNFNGTRDPGEDVNMNGVADVRTLPTEFSATGTAVVSRVLLQSRKMSDYSWMLNVRRRGDGMARSVDVVVKFSDGADLESERVYEATFVPSSTVPPITSRSVWVKKTVGPPAAEPNIRKGKFIFDAVNAIWYRIQDVQEKPLFGTGGTPFDTFDYLVTVEEPIKAGNGSGASTGGVPASAGPFGLAMFPSGIVDVYPMGSINMPDDMQISTF